MYSREERNGFTLVELLVVISVIAILAAILLPALTASKLKAYQLICINNTKQLALIESLYLQDYGKEAPRTPDSGDPNGLGFWYREKGGSLYDTPDIRICPLAKYPFLGPDGPPEGGRYGDNQGSAANCWRVASDAPADDLTGSYAFNSWFGDDILLSQPVSNFFSGNNVRFPERTPLFSDSLWALVQPQTNDPVSTDLFGHSITLGLAGSPVAPLMACVTIARHGGKTAVTGPYNWPRTTPLPRTWGVNISFYDGHAELVKLPDLLTLTWNRNWNP